MLGELRPVDGGSPIFLDKPSLTFGNDRTCDVVIEHPSVSANHCHMEFRDGHWFIEDLGSRGGIGVNGEKVESAWVPALSVINIGAIEFDLEYTSHQATTQEGGPVSQELLAKLDQAAKSVTSIKDKRTQVRADQPAPAWVPKTKFGMLVSIDGKAAIPLLYDELYLGRGADCDVILPYLSVSNTHCVLRFQEGYWLVRDLNNNGITIDGESIQEGWLLPGAVLGVATHLFEVDYSTSATSPPPEMAVAINEFDVSDEDSTVDGDAVMHASEFEVVEVDESALIDDDDEHENDASHVDIDNEWDTDNDTLIHGNAQAPASESSDISPRPFPVDEPLSIIDEVQRSIEEMLPPIEGQPLPVAELKSVKPQIQASRMASAPGLSPEGA
ncbi:MAG: FHA domain-containing protein, partial [Fuerstia sp.]|nr:FHA domain-containing protein [Fuerstiella sp.]